MSNFTSKTRIDLGVQPSLDSPELYSELLIVYKAIKSLHLALAENENPEQIDINAIQLAELLDFYTLNFGSRLILQAGSTINAGSFVGYRVNEAKLEMIHQRAPSTYTISQVGWALNDAAVNDPVVVYVSPAIIPFFTGLTSGALYYGTAVGALTTAAGAGISSNLPVGIALSDKILKLYSLVDFYAWR